MPLDYFEIPIALSPAPGRQLLTTICCISPDLFETREQWGESDEQTPSPFSIVHISGGHVHGQEQTKRINKDMALASFDAFMCIETADCGRLFNGFDTLRIYDRRAWLGVPPNPLAFGFSQSREQPKPGTFQAQAPEMLEHGLPWRKIGWQVAPWTTGAQDVKNGIKNGTQGVGRRPASFGLRREMALQTLPLRIRKIAGVTRTHPSSLSQEIISAINKTRSYRELPRFMPVLL